MIYLLCFSAPLGDPSRAHMSARHYLGWATEEDWRDRIAAHLAGRGAAITRAAVAQGIELRIARLWPGEDRTRERRLKRAGHFADRLCPECRAAARPGPEAVEPSPPTFGRAAAPPVGLERGL